jgi:3-hydroxyacyl-[acyl-carrier-protein] dehydratase
MRWFWIDRFIEFESGRRAVAVKNVLLAGEESTDYIPGFPIFPPCLIIEGLAQAGGLLFGELNQFGENVVLAKVSKASFYELARPADRLVYTLNLLDVKPEGAIVGGTCHIGDRLLAEAELCFAHLDKKTVGGDTIKPSDFARIVETTRLYQVGRDAQGQPLKFPARLAAAIASPNYRDDGACRM